MGRSLCREAGHVWSNATPTKCVTCGKRLTPRWRWYWWRFLDWRESRRG